MFSYGGRVLRVDLATDLVDRRPTDAALARSFLGGRGLNVKWLYDHLPDALADGLAPGNILVFGAGPLVGTSFPGGARFNISALSPQTGILGDSNAGGFFGPEMKFAGYDQIVIEGRSPRPVYLFVEDDRVEVRDAAALWGADVSETTAAIERVAGDRVQVAAIGPGAENGVRFAGVFVNRHRAAARTGMGAVMASKNLKAVAIRGTRSLEVADMARFTSLVARLDERIAAHPEYDSRARLGTTRLVRSLDRIGALPTRHFDGRPFAGVDAVSGETIERLHKVKGKACFACTIPCSRFLSVADPRFPLLEMEGPEYEPLAGFTARIGNSDLPLALHCIDLASRYGLDAIALSEVIAWAMECYARGLLTRGETGGLDLSWGNPEAIVSLVHAVARREGLGDLLADGVRRAAERLGRGSEAFALHSKGLEIFQADLRTIKAYALGNAVSSRGADHLRSEPWFEFSNDPAEGVRRFGVAETAFRLEHRGKGVLVKHFEEMAAIADATGVCKNTYNNMEVLDWNETADLLTAATGRETTGEDVRRIGERIVNLERLFNARRGIGRKDDTLPARFLEEPLPEDNPSAGAVVELDAMLDEYYRARGWDPATGLPTPGKLKELGL